MTDRHAAEAREKARQEKNVYKRRALTAEARNAALLAALEAQEAYDRGSPNPWGHDCRWCGDCMERITSMRRTAIEAAKEIGL